MRLSLIINFLLLDGHRVGGDETDSIGSQSKDQREPASRVGFSQGKIPVFAVDKLLFDHRGIVTINTARLLRRKQRVLPDDFDWRRPSRKRWELPRFQCTYTVPICHFAELTTKSEFPVGVNVPPNVISSEE